MKNAIVTFVIGDEYQKMYDTIFRPSVESYCKKYDIDLILLNEPFEKMTITRNNRQELLLQKLLVCSQDWAQKYDAICWIEADILISPRAQNIFDEVKDDKILFVEGSIYNDPFYGWVYSHKNKITTIDLKEACTTSFEGFKKFGIDTEHEDMSYINEGVMVFQPKYHAEYLKNFYVNKPVHNQSAGRDNTFVADGEIWWYGKVMADRKHRLINHRYNVPWNYYRRTHIEPYDDPKSIIIPIKNYMDNSYFCHIGDRENLDMIHLVEKIYFRNMDTTLVVKCGPVDKLHWLLSSYIRAKEFKDIYIVCEDDSAKNILFSNYPRMQYANWFPHDVYKFVKEVPEVSGRCILCDSDWIDYKDFDYMLNLFYEDKNESDLIKVVNT